MWLSCAFEGRSIYVACQIRFASLDAVTVEDSLRQWWVCNAKVCSNFTGLHRSGWSSELDSFHIILGRIGKRSTCSLPSNSCGFKISAFYSRWKLIHLYCLLAFVSISVFSKSTKIWRFDKGRCILEIYIAVESICLPKTPLVNYVSPDWTRKLVFHLKLLNM